MIAASWEPADDGPVESGVDVSPWARRDSAHQRGALSLPYLVRLRRRPQDGPRPAVIGRRRVGMGYVVVDGTNGRVPDRTR